MVMAMFFGKNLLILYMVFSILLVDLDREYHT